jgi:tRNA 2-thiouridine synthesizing protein A
MSAPDEVLDFRGLKCPMPALLLAKAIGAARTGETIIAEADDPMSYVDLVHAAERLGCRVLSCVRNGEVTQITIICWNNKC